MKKKIVLGLIGHGVVGSGTLEVLRRHAPSINERVGAPIEVKWLCRRHPEKTLGLPASIRQTKNWNRVVNDPEVDCVVELIGGVDPAKKIIMRSLQNGKHVVTANKTVMSRYWNDIFDIANREKKLVSFEAAVGGGIPVVQALNEGLAANEIRKIIGILNGTTNFILTQMQEAGLSFKEALKQAQTMGFAEANPKADIEGIDAAQKISILGSLAARGWIAPEHVYHEGISKLSPVDIRMIKERLHSTIKLLGIAEKTMDGWTLRVHPTLIPASHPFANVRNEYNAISLQGDSVGDIMLYGKGAGRLPTSSAVVSDIIFLCRQIANGMAGRVPYVTRRVSHKVRIGTMESVKDRYYLRISAKDRPGVLSRITGILGEHRVSIATIHQDAEESIKGRRVVPIILLTDENWESDVQNAVKAINAMPTTMSKTVLLRML